MGVNTFIGPALFPTDEARVIKSDAIQVPN